MVARNTITNNLVVQMDSDVFMPKSVTLSFVAVFILTGNLCFVYCSLTS